MGLRLKLGTLLAGPFLLASVCAQSPPSKATVGFTLDFPGSNPSHYEIVVASDGHGTYSSNGQLSEHSDPVDPAQVEFMVSSGVRAQVFSLAERAHFFSGKLDSGRSQIANTGAKTLAYKDDHLNTHATYNYSTVRGVEQLTSIFEALSTTLEFGRRLSYYHKYEKLALEEDLKRMEELAKENNLGDIEVVAPVLREIANDPAVINVSRARALRLLASAGK